MTERKSATTMNGNEWENFAKALVLMKADILNPNQPEIDHISAYDLLDAIHVAIRRVRTPDGRSTNMGHFSAGFCPWHRNFLLNLESEMQKHVPSSFIPFWDWTDHPGTKNLFVKEKLGERSGRLISGYFAFDAPGTGSNSLPRPNWWPPTLKGWRIPKTLRYRHGESLYRTNNLRILNRELATQKHVEAVMNTDDYSGGAMVEWTEPGSNTKILIGGGFWNRLEGGPNGGVPRTHNFGHGWIGGQMGDAFTSPLDPIFYLHHCNIDRIWAEWQNDGHLGNNYYPSFGFDMGHNLKDPMWPWVGNSRGYNSESSPIGIPWPNFSAGQVVTPQDVIDISKLNYTYSTL